MRQKWQKSNYFWRGAEQRILLHETIYTGFNKEEKGVTTLPERLRQSTWKITAIYQIGTTSVFGHLLHINLSITVSQFI